MAALTLRTRISSAADVERAQRTARALAVELGCGPVTAERVALATMELATNLIRYAQGGWLEITRIEGTRSGVRLSSEDSGPGIVDLGLARTDGYTTGGGLGSGLGSIERLMDETEFRSTSDGTVIVARKWAEPT